MTNSRWFALIGGITAIALIGFAAGRGVRSMRSHPRYGMQLESTTPVDDARLTSQDGQPVSLRDFQGQLVLLYFGYTTCPDVCPATLAEVHQALQLLGKQADDVNVVMVTVDPDRDTQAVLADYMKHFDPRFIALRGSAEQTQELAMHCGVYFARRKTTSSLGYLVDHSASLLLIDRQSRLRIMFPSGTKAEQLADDLKVALNG